MVITGYKRRFSLLAAVMLLAGLLVPFTPARTAAAPIAQLAPGSTKSDVTYCTAGGVDLKMDIYMPKSAQGTGPTPALIYVHGGGWTSGSKSWVDHVLSSGELASRGYFVAAIDYRLAPQYKWPAQIEDTKCAVRYLRSAAAQYNIDPARIGVWGESAGGHLVAMLGLAGSGAGFEGKGGHPEQSSAVEAVVDMCGPTDFTTVPVNAFNIEMSRMLLGTTMDKASDIVRLASPVTHVNSNSPPFLIMQGEQDPIVPAAQSQELYDKLREAGSPATLVMVKNGGHVFAPNGGPISPSMPEIQQKAYSFFDSVLKAPKPNAAYFSQTGKIAQGKFLDYWQKNGGLAQQGFPISGEIQEKNDTNGKLYTVQYFERSVFELHPENKPPYDVLLSLLGNYRYKQKYPKGAPGQTPNTTEGSTLFKETGKRVGGKFLDYWQKNGGLAQQGFPISDEFQEKSDLDGKTYTVQYFERAVFEYHPDNKPPYDVLLSQLGTFRSKDKYPSK